MACELELKYVVPPERAAAVERALRAAGARAAALVAHYHDTPDGALARRGVALRLRREGGRWVQTLKAGAAGRIARLEHEVPAGRAVAPGEPPPIDIARHDASGAAADALAAALADAGGAAALVRRYAVEVRRLTVDVALPSSGSVVEVVFDRGRIVAGERSVPVCEVEYELESGPDASALVALAARGIDDHGLWLSVASKAERGERLARGIAAGAPAGAASPAIDRSMTGDAVARAVVEACLAQILPNASDLAAGVGGDEHVHQLRIGLRRLRTALRELGTVAHALDPVWDAPLADAQRRLGAVRDATVLAALRPALEAAGAPWLPGEPPAVPADAGAVVREPAFQHALLNAVGFALGAGAEHGAEPALAPAAVAAQLRARLTKLHRGIAREARRFETLDEAAQHRVRKRCKRLRYLAESVQPLFDEGGDGAALARCIARLRQAQDALGAHADTIVARRAFERHAADGEPRAWFAVGWLQSRQAETARAGRKALRRVAKAPPLRRG